MARCIPCVAAFAAGSILCAATASAIVIPTVPIGNPGNAPDSTGYGSVAYAYNIGTTEVTIGQYTAFLNAVADSDTYGLYSTAMNSPLSGISRSGLPGVYHYSANLGRANNPVNFVSFWDAARFANWLHNGQPSGAQDASTTEDGAYTLTQGGITANSVARNGGAQWAIASEDEWYKAAYHQPASQGGDSDDYWLYPTQSNTAPIPGLSPTGQANYGGVIGNTTPVGSYAANFYGTVDMGGNVWEWDEAIMSGSARGVRGGSIGVNSNILQAGFRVNDVPTDEGDYLGFRVVQVPVPSSVVLLGLGGLMASRRRRS